MSDRYGSRLDVWGKVDNEGGIYDAIVNYGIKASDMPEGDTELAEAWQKLEDAFEGTQPLLRAVEKMLDEAYDEALNRDDDQA